MVMVNLFKGLTNRFEPARFNAGGLLRAEDQAGFEEVWLWDKVFFYRQGR